MIIAKESKGIEFVKKKKSSKMLFYRCYKVENFIFEELSVPISEGNL